MFQAHGAQRCIQDEATGAEKRFLRTVIDRVEWITLVQKRKDDEVGVEAIEGI